MGNAPVVLLTILIASNALLKCIVQNASQRNMLKMGNVFLVPNWIIAWSVKAQKLVQNAQNASMIDIM